MNIQRQVKNGLKSMELQLLPRKLLPTIDLL